MPLTLGFRHRTGAGCTKRCLAKDHVPEINLRNLDFAFEGSAPVLHDVTLHVPEGDFAALVGPSGCGKSTLLRIVAGLLLPTRGNLDLTARTPAEDAPRIGFVFQQPTLLPWRRVLDNIALPLELQSIPASARWQAAERARKLVGLSEQDLPKYPRMLSGGMQMRVSIARALVTNPRIMLLDEPFAALDDILRGQLNEDIWRLWQQNRWTTLFVTHNVSEAVLLSQRVLVMSPHPGRVVREILIPLPFPRGLALRGTAEYARLVGEVSMALVAAAGGDPRTGLSKPNI